MKSLKFPKDIVQRKIWLKFCKVDELDITSSTMLCNKHFTEEDFLIRAGDDCKILKAGSLPSSGKSDKIKERLIQETSATNSNNLSHESSKNPILIEEPTNVDTYVTSESNVTKVIERTIRYPGDITISHLKTPKKAKMALNVAKTTILKQKRKIKTLQQASNRHKQKIRSLKKLVEQLKKNNLISENAAKVLLAQMSYVAEPNKALPKDYERIQGIFFTSHSTTLQFILPLAHSFIDNSVITTTRSFRG